MLEVSRLINREICSKNNYYYLVFPVDYYRVLYDDSLHQLVKNLLDSSNGIVSLSSKSQLLDDYFVAAYNSESPCWVF